MIEHNRFTFEVAKCASKPQIADAVSEIFGVTVTNVNTMNVTGKPRRVRVAKARRATGRRHRHSERGRFDRVLPGPLGNRPRESRLSVFGVFSVMEPPARGSPES